MKLKNKLITSAFIVLGTTSINAQVYMCQSCKPGTYSETGEETECSKCAAGTYSGAGASSCSNCPAGKYSGVGAGSCTSCSAGTYQNLTGQSSCKSCSAGTYQNLTGQSSCKSCNAGTYQDKTGQSSCKTCGTGTYSGVGASSCKTCSAGTYSPAGSGSCYDCYSGYYSSAGAGSCSMCQAGTYAPAGSSSCKNCGTGTYSAAGAGTCLACTNAPAKHSHYTSNATSNSCSWACDSGYVLKKGECKKEYIICLKSITNASYETIYTYTCKKYYPGDYIDQYEFEMNYGGGDSEHLKENSGCTGGRKLSNSYYTYDKTGSFSCIANSYGGYTSKCITTGSITVPVVTRTSSQSWSTTNYETQTGAGGVRCTVKYYVAEE